METFLVVYHLSESRQRQVLGGLRANAGAHHCIIKRNNMKEVLEFVTEIIAPDVLGLEIHPIETEIGAA